MRARRDLSGLGLLAALFLAALALRPQLVGVAPVVPRIQEDLAISHAVAGLLGTIPVLCMGLFAPPAPYLSRRVGSRLAIAVALGLIAGFGLVRAVAPGAALVVLLTFPVGIGMGLAGALMPVAVKERFAHRPAFATGVYATGISAGSALSTALAVPLAEGAGGWRGTLVAFSACTAALVFAWLVLTRRTAGRDARADALPALPWRSGVAWRLVSIFGLMSVVYYGLNAWLPDSYVERGWSESSAGSLLAVLNVAALPPTLLVPWLADRMGSRRVYLVTAGSLLTATLVALVLLPGGGWAWAALAGAAFGALFPIVLTLPLDVSDRPAQVGAVAGLMLGAGYALSAASPFGLGVARDATGSFTAALWVLAGASALLAASCAALSPRRLSP